MDNAKYSTIDTLPRYDPPPERETLQQQRMFEALLGKADGNVQ